MLLLWRLLLLQPPSLLELQVPGQLVLGLLQVLPVLDVDLLDVVDLGLHRLQFGKQLQEAETRQGAAAWSNQSTISTIGMNQILLLWVCLLPHVGGAVVFHIEACCGEQTPENPFHISTCWVCFCWLWKTDPFLFIDDYFLPQLLQSQKKLFNKIEIFFLF